MRKSFIFLVLVIFTIPIFSQDGYKVTYHISEPKPYRTPDNLSQQVKELTQKVLNASKSIRYTLTVNEKNSYFEMEDFLSVGESTAMDELYFDTARHYASFNEEVYINYTNNQVIFVRSLANKDFTVKTDFIDFKWELINEEKIIANLKAYKATGTYFDPIKNKEFPIIAWYAPSIPISAGPDIFTGLPGLIAEIELKGAVVSIKDLQVIDNIEIKNIDDSKAMTLNEYHNLIKDLTSKFIEDD